MSEANEVKYRPARECFKVVEGIRASHLLYKDFMQERTDMGKLPFYIWLQENELKAKRGQDENGWFGYGLEYVPKPDQP